jgi:O-antigen ligase
MSPSESLYANVKRMTGPRVAASISRRLPTWLFFALLVLCFLGGGSSRPDIHAQPLIWLLSILCCGTALWIRPLSYFAPLRLVLIFVSLMAAIIAVQLIPLPPSLWTALPGRGLYAETAIVTKLSLTWHPISLTPDLTWATLFATLPAFATVIGFGCLASKDRKHILNYLLVAVIGSAVLGLSQISAGAESALRYYPITNSDSAVGLFANRNHNALFLVLGLPMLAVWSTLDKQNSRRTQIHNWVAAAAALFLVPMIIVTGSRAGAILGVLAFFGALLLARAAPTGSSYSASLKKWSTWSKILSLVLLLLVLTIMIVSSRMMAIDRLFASSVAEDGRVQMLVPLWKMLRCFFPFGSGFGSFDPVFRAFEPFESLSTAYMNHAHNDLLHIIIEGGLPAAALLVAYLSWWMMRVRFLWTIPKQLTSARLMGRLGTVMTGLMLLASLVDYPLRMPVLGVVFMIATLWMVKVPDRD